MLHRVAKFSDPVVELVATEGADHAAQVRAARHRLVREVDVVLLADLLALFQEVSHPGPVVAAIFREAETLVLGVIATSDGIGEGFIGAGLAFVHVCCGVLPDQARLVAFIGVHPRVREKIAFWKARGKGVSDRLL